MFLRNEHVDYGKPLHKADTETLGSNGADAIERHLAHRDNAKPTPLYTLPGLAAELGIGALYVKDESHRLGLESFKALGGAYAVIRLALEAAEMHFGRKLDNVDFKSPEVCRVAAGMTFACATDGNHGHSVAQGASLVGAQAVIFVHGGVSDARIAKIARMGAQVVRVDGTYDDSVAEAIHQAAKNHWIIVADTSWEGYERIPGLVMQGYTALVREAMRQWPAQPTHVFVQAGVGGVAAAVAAHLAETFGKNRPVFTVVEPTRAACVAATARAGQLTTVMPGEPTVMAMLECYAASPIAWRVLSRVADAFMAIDDAQAVKAMTRLAYPISNDPPIVAGESGGAGLAGLFVALDNIEIRQALGLNAASRVLVINTEGATDPGKYQELVGCTPHEVGRDRHAAPVSA